MIGRTRLLEGLLHSVDYALPAPDDAVAQPLAPTRTKPPPNGSPQQNETFADDNYGKEVDRHQKQHGDSTPETPLHEGTPNPGAPGDAEERDRGESTLRLIAMELLS